MRTANNTKKKINDSVFPFTKMFWPKYVVHSVII